MHHRNKPSKIEKPKKKDPIQIGIDVDAIVQDSAPKKHRSHHVVVSFEHVHKSFPVGGSHVRALKDISLHLYSGEFVIIYGPSGCGKSTMLHTILGLEKPTHGKVYVRSHSIYDLETDERTQLRRQYFGMVFQQSHWIKALNVWENVAYPLLLSGERKEHIKDHAMSLLHRLGIESFAKHSPLQLSGGQQQKVALARALATNPWVIIADEPTGNLDSESGKEVMELLVRLNRDEKRMVILVTHDLTLLPLATRKVGLKDGSIIFDEHDPS